MGTKRGLSSDLTNGCGRICDQPTCNGTTSCKSHRTSDTSMTYEFPGGPKRARKAHQKGPLLSPRFFGKKGDSTNQILGEKIPRQETLTEPYSMTSSNNWKFKPKTASRHALRNALFWHHDKIIASLWIYQLLC